jgi:predicted small metal-binding protein
MAKLLKCNDLNPRCIFEIRGNSEAAVLEKAAEHFQADHNMQNISPDILSKARSAIRDEAEGQAQTASSL